jgi:hypothetical protein
MWAAGELHHASPKDILDPALRDALAGILRDLNIRKAKDQEGTTVVTIKAICTI